MPFFPPGLSEISTDFLHVLKYLYTTFSVQGTEDLCAFFPPVHKLALGHLKDFYWI